MLEGDSARNPGATPADELRRDEYLLAGQYRTRYSAKRLDDEDLDCEDLADAEHWVEVYRELLEFTRSVLEEDLPGASIVEIPRPDQALTGLRALMLQAQVQQLHLTYWVGRLDQLRRESASDGKQRQGT